MLKRSVKKLKRNLGEMIASLLEELEKNRIPVTVVQEDPPFPYPVTQQDKKDAEGDLDVDRPYSSRRPARVIVQEIPDIEHIVG